jgi:hypothetical protein
MLGLGAANVVPLIFSLASESGGALGNNISFVAIFGYSGVLTRSRRDRLLRAFEGIWVAFGGVACLLAMVALSGLIAAPDRRP